MDHRAINIEFRINDIYSQISMMKNPGESISRWAVFALLAMSTFLIIDYVNPQNYLIPFAVSMIFVPIIMARIFPPLIDDSDYGVQEIIANANEDNSD